MKTARRDGAVRMKLTISREEHPALFEALFCIRNPRRRTGRLKELIIKGLTLELTGGTSGPMRQQATGGLAVGMAGANGTKVGQTQTSVASMLEWDASQS
jgi:hypothetical protein